MKTRSLILYGLLAVTLAATWWTARNAADDSATVEVVERPERVAAMKHDRNVIAFVHTTLNPAARDAFAPRDWTPPPPPPPKALPPPPPAPPMAPPLPYRYLGKWLEDGKLVVFLQAGNRSILVRGGEILDGQWKVDEITPRSAQFVYLPLAQTTTLNIGDAL